MEGGRDDHSRAQRPEEGALQVEAAVRRPGHHARHDEPRQEAGASRTSGDDLQEAEGSFHEPPVLAVRAEAGEEGPAGGEVRQIRDRHDGAEGRDGPPPPAARQRGQRRRGGHLGEGGEAEGRAGAPSCADADAGLPGPMSSQDGQGQKKKPQGLEMSAPRHLDHQERSPRVEEQHQEVVPARLPRHADQHPRRPQVAGEPEELGHQEGGARQRHQEEGELREGRVDGGHRRVVDPVMVRRPEGFQLGGRRGVDVRVRARELHVAVPEVAMDVVGELGSQGQEGESQRYRKEPDRAHPWGSRALLTGPFPPRRHVQCGDEVGREGHAEDEEPGKGESMGPRPPAQRGQGRQLHQPQEDEAGREHRAAHEAAVP